ncbi:MAG: MBOAT family protein [Planctomycetaceae bacterium]|nr:MBOAT family protein [Planctomycetaceae bacterium]
MFFNSFEFAVFLPVVVAVFWLLVRVEKLRNWWLILASYYFYCCWDWRFAFLILLSTIVDYYAGLIIDRAKTPKSRKTWLIVSLVVNLGCLGFFKYCDFFIVNFQTLMGTMGIQVPIAPLHIILPVGISFYTFQTLSYTLDIYKGTLKPTRDFSKFALFVVYFPQLVAGPIVRAQEFMPQLEHKPNYDDDATVRGVYQIFAGLFKKIMIADVLAVTLVDPAFRNPETFSGFWLLLAVYAYAMQIYCDFSGYSDIAIGSARLCGFVLPINFNRPYIATSLTDFWRRWHITLSTWLRDYLYISLGGNRWGSLLTYRNLFITMLLGGLWHGAAWNFVIWGGIHGIGLAVEKMIFGGKRLLNLDGLPRWIIFLRWLITFHVIMLCWIFFRAQPTESLTTMGAAWTVITKICTLAPGESGYSLWFVGMLILGYAMHFTPLSWKRQWTNLYTKSGTLIQAGICTILLLLYTFLGVGGAAFIYFQF